MIIFNKPKNGKKNYIAIVAIGKSFLNLWKKNCCTLVLDYCKNHNLGLVVIENKLISEDSKFYKKPQWTKLLVAKHLIEKKINFNNICIMDADILVNPLAPNIFDYHKVKKISVVPLRHNLPYNFHNVSRRISFFRHNFYTKKYPLNSSLNMTIKEIYNFHRLKNLGKFFCSGIIVFNKSFSNYFFKIFFKYTKDVKSITNNGEQTHLNYEVLKNKNVNWLDYKFQAIWNYEMAYYYPFLYFNRNKKLSNLCIETSLMNNYFLHFAGSWHESRMLDHFKLGNLMKRNYFLKKYVNKIFRAKPKGMIKIMK
jgi:hypothetical protein